MLAAEARVLPGIEEPYPGLRAFEPRESLLFFGRRAHTEALLERLATHRLLAVVGTSGSGKSSLVRAGLVPALYRGHLAGSSSKWRIVLMRPGESPLGKLAEALSASTPSSEDRDRLRATLERSSLGLMRAVRESGLAPGENVLLVVDQFEEIFRFRGARKSAEREAEASLFVSSLLEAAGQIEVPIYVVLTMRSDFLGECARFTGLPEALNESQYLVPKLTRSQRQEAIEGPLRVAGVSVSPALVQRVLNDAGEEPDRLPVLQHALMRTFRLWKSRGGAGPVGLEDYDAAGGMTEALDRHATEVFEALPGDRHRRAAEKIFRCLTTLEKGRAVRRPTSLERILAVTGAADPQAREIVEDVIRRFSAKENSFVLSSTSLELGPESILDISHESLIAKWTLLGAWVLQEVKVADCYRYLSRDAGLYPAGAGLWRDPELAQASQYFGSGELNEAWSRQYDEGPGAGFLETERFLRESLRAQKEERERKKRRRHKAIEDAHRLASAEARAKRWFGGAAVLLFLLLLMTALAFRSYRVSERMADEARDQRINLALAESRAEETRKRLADIEAQGGRSEAELSDLRRRLAEYETQAKQAQAAIATSPQPMDQTDRKTGALIASLQDQLRVAREERDGVLARGPISQPTAVVVTENSLVPLEPAPYRRRVAFLAGSIGGAEARVYVLLSDIPGAFKSSGKNYLERLGNRECPGYFEEKELAVWCVVVPEGVTLKPREVGSFRLDGASFAILATGWSRNVATENRKEASVLSFSVFPGPERKASYGK